MPESAAAALIAEKQRTSGERSATILTVSLATTEKS